MVTRIESSSVIRLFFLFLQLVLFGERLGNSGLSFKWYWTLAFVNGNTNAKKYVELIEHNLWLVVADISSKQLYLSRLCR